MNPYEILGLKQVINGSGKMTALGASIVDRQVADFMKEAAMNYVEIEALINRAGQIIAPYTGAEDACVTNCAAAGIAIAVAACIAKDKLSLIERLPVSEGLSNQVVIQKGHAIHFGGNVLQMIRLGGGIPLEAGHANQVELAHLEEAINEKTAALFYVKSHHAVQKGMVPLEKMMMLAKKHHVPLIVDSAAEEDLKYYIELGADLVIYSGAKAIGGPTSGFVTGKRELIHYCKLQYKGIGRAMKVGKENIMGLLKALERYGQNREEKSPAFQKKKMLWLVNEVNQINGLKATLSQDEAGREIYRAQIQVEGDAPGAKAAEVIRRLEAGNPSIYTRNHYANLGIINIDPRPLKEGEEKVILKALGEMMNSL